MCRPKNLMKIRHLTSLVQYHGSEHCSCDENVISVETDEPFTGPNFHNGWWRIMITEVTRLWLTLFSRLCHSIDRQVSQSEASENAIQDLSSMSISGYLAVWCSSLWSSRSKMTDKSHLWYLVKLWWHLLEASVYAIDSHNTAAAAWGTFSEIFLTTSLDLRAQSRVLSCFYIRWMVAVLCLVNTNMCPTRDKASITKREICQKRLSVPA